MLARPRPRGDVVLPSCLSSALLHRAQLSITGAMRAVALLLVLLLRQAGAQAPNPFLATTPVPLEQTASIRSPEAAVTALPAPPQAPKAAAGTAPAAAPAYEAPAALSSDPCTCSSTGLSGGANTSRVGCSQWNVAAGSSEFTWWVPAAKPERARWGAARRGVSLALKLCSWRHSLLAFALLLTQASCSSLAAPPASSMILQSAHKPWRLLPTQSCPVLLAVHVRWMKCGSPCLLCLGFS